MMVTHVIRLMIFINNIEIVFTDDVDMNDADAELGWLSFANDDGMHIRETR